MSCRIHSAAPGLTFAVFLLSATVVSAGSFAPDPGWTEPEVFYGSFGESIATAGDVNSDGFADVILAGPFYVAAGGPSTNQEGVLLVYHGSNSGLDEFYDWFEIGPNPGTTLGYRVAFAGDLDDDGFDDVLFNSGSGFGGGTHRLHARFGSGSGLGGTWDFDSGEMYGALGPNIAAGGDIDDDGFTDIVAGFPLSDGDRGRLRIFHGSASGLPATPDQEMIGQVNQHLGDDVVFAGDVDGDGYDDVLICDRDTGAGGASIDLHHGSITGLEPDPAWSYPRPDGITCGFGRPLSSAGDLNDDGYDDAIIGVPQLSHDGGEGALLVVLGSADGFGAEPNQVLYGEGRLGYAVHDVGDVNGDGFSDIVAGAPFLSEGAGESGRAFVFLGSDIGLQPEPAWVNNPVLDSLRVGYSVSPAGDVNGDGLVDLLVADPATPVGNGRVHLFYGIETLTVGPAGAILPEEGAFLRVDKAASGNLALSWDPSCLGGEEDYAIYAGSTDDFASHQPVTCSTGKLKSWEVSASDGSRYYLVVPRSLDSEGSYGIGAASAERLPSTGACLPQSVGSCD